MKLALIADTHGGMRNDNPHLLKNFERSCEWFFNELKRRNIDDIFHLGDLYDRRRYLNFETARVVRESFLKPAGNHYATYIIAGNHDEYFKDSHETNSLNEIVTGKYPTIRTFTEPRHVSIGNFKIALIPWITDTNRAQTLDFIEKSDADVVMGHLELAGFEMHKNVFKEHGDDPDIFKKFKAVYTGHFHKKSSNRNIHYIGAFSEYIWSDYDCPRGFSILDTDTLELELVENPHRMFKQINYDDSKGFPDLDYEQYRNTYVRVVVANRDNMFDFDHMIDNLYDVHPIDVTVVEDIESFIDLDPDAAVDQSQDTPAILDTYISNLTLPVETSIMQGYMRDMYKEAISIEHTNE